MTFIADILFSGTLTIHGVLRCIDSVVGEWFQLGLELGVPASTMETIEYDHPKDVKTCKRKMIQEWLKLPQPSWYSLASAVKITGLDCVAQKISDEYSMSEYCE